MKRLIAQRPQKTIISQKARFWPEIPREKVVLPAPPGDPGGANALTILTLLMSVAGIAVSGFIFSRLGGGSSLFFIAFLAMGAFAAVGSLVTFIVQSVTTKRQLRYLDETYTQRLLEMTQQLQQLKQRERVARTEIDPPFVPPISVPDAYGAFPAVTPIVQRGIDDADIMLWSRRPTDPDFLSVRIGIGSLRASYEVNGEQEKEKIALPTPFEQQNAYASALIARYSTLPVPFTIALNKGGPIAISASTQHTKLESARDVARTLVAHLTYHHSPEDLHVLVIAPKSQASEWQWAKLLPHTHLFDIAQGTPESDALHGSPAVALGPEVIVELLPMLSRELGRRELLLGDESQLTTSATAPLPHLLVVVDHFDVASDLDPPPLALPLMNFKQSSMQGSNRSRLTVSPLKRAELTLALSHGTRLGVTVLCICADKADIPVNSGTLIDLDVVTYDALAGTTLIELPSMETPIKKRGRKQQVAMVKPPIIVPAQACVRLLQPEPPAFLACDLLDSIPLDALLYIAKKMQMLQPAVSRRVQLRTQVDLRNLFEPPLDLLNYDPRTLWADPAYRLVGQNGLPPTPSLRIPIGQKLGDEVQYLNLIKDGPHGLLIGQTGSGKSELLQTIIMSLALLYKPNEMTFLLIDYKAGLALEPFRTLPHTIGFLSNVSSTALIQRFITMLRAEAVRRERKLHAGESMPRLLIVIDEFAEMANRTENVLTELFTITRVGREIGMHLLLSAQRPEGIISTKVRDYVQYRLCLRCASPDDSREVLGRIDAANLPASIPGRGYLLHGDNQLDLFQAARVTLPTPM